MMRLSLPGFSAERSIYADHGAFGGAYDFAGAHVKPTLHAACAVVKPQTPATGKACFTCRSSCFIRWRNNGTRLQQCLDRCPCDF
jgi:hypothetical protein